MAEKGDVPVTLEMIATADTKFRRRSMGWISSLNSGEKFVPHYLRASTGSCHDVCKYGRNHTFETKSRQPMPTNVERKSLDGGSLVDIKETASTRMPKNVARKSLDGGSLVDIKETASTRMPKNVARKSLDGGSLVDRVVLPEIKETASTRMPKNVARKSLDGGSSVDSMVLLQRKITTSTWMTKNVARKSLDGGSSVDSMVLPEIKKTTLTRMLNNVARKSLDGGTSAVSAILPERRKTGGSSKDSVVLPERKKATSTRAETEFSSTSRISAADLTIFIRPKLSVEPSGFPGPVQREVPNERKKKLLPSQMQREVLNERKKGLLAEPRTLPKSRSHTTNALKNLKPEAFSATRNPEDSVVQVVVKAKERKLPEKSDRISKPKFIKVKPLRSSGSLDISKRKNDSKMGKSFGTSKEAAKKVVAASMGSLSSNSIRGTANATARKRVNLKGVPLKAHSRIKVSAHEQVRSEEVQEETFESEEVQEKTLYVIKIENEEIPQQSDQNETYGNMEAVPSFPPKSLSPPPSPSHLANVEDQDVSDYTESEAEDDSYYEGDEIGSMEADNTSSEGSKKGNLTMLQPKEEDPPSTKLSFRRGKIIDIRTESNSPRRLKFRRVRLLGEGQKAVDGLRKNFKRGEEMDNGIETTQETVVLRHQGVQGKKDAQGLFNNVIEETASKLVETRKSKVKALVGAFETVISLQDGKPSLES